ncbi:MAG: transcriptional regulator [Gemmatales bacterium]|nr:MAG: transcriptional regulator [Gemmatales bacterium]
MDDYSETEIADEEPQPASLSQASEDGSSEDAESLSAIAKMVETPTAKRLVEAMLFVGGAPLSPAKAVETIRGLSEEQFLAIVEELNTEYRRQGRPYTIMPLGRGYIMTLRPTFKFVRERLYGGVREARLSQAAIDVLALVAYQQPIDKQEIETIRGYESGAILKQLVRRNLIAVVPRDGQRKETAYCTTQRFLQLFGLSSLEDLPQIQSLERL